MRLRRRRDLVCRDAVRLMTDYLEGALSPRDAERLERHLGGCVNCTEYLAQLRSVVDAAGRADTEDLSPEALEELTDLYRRWRDDGSL